MEKAISKISHPNIISIIECKDEALGIFKPRPFLSQESQETGANCSAIVMEFARHGDLFDFALAHNKNDEKLARTIFRQLIEGMKHLHHSKIAHMDLKFENILIADNFVLKITDFDLSQKLDEKKPEVKGRGTIHFRGPEVRDGMAKDFKAADVYSLGIMLFFMVMGKLPYGEDTLVQNEDLQELLYFDT
jgi:serine/threonine protein kinase